MLSISSSLASLVSSYRGLDLPDLDAEEPVFFVLLHFHLINNFLSLFQMTLFCYQHPLAELPL